MVLRARDIEHCLLEANFIFLSPDGSNSIRGSRTLSNN